MWSELLEDYELFLRLEKGLSENTIEAYIRDNRKLIEYLSVKNQDIKPKELTSHMLSLFMQELAAMGIAERTQARLLSSIKSFFLYLEYEEIIEENPSSLFEGPRLSTMLPDVLSVHEINNLQDAIDLSKAEGQRNKAIIEVLYSCGLRVSELVNLLISNLHFKEGYIKVDGKGNKQRLVPISTKAIKELELYFFDRKHLNIKPGHEDIVFLNRRGRQLTRVMIFTIIKQLAENIGMKKSISPHTFRHSFATHLVEGGADLRSVQEMLGHESILTTEIYTHLDRQHLRDTINLYHPRSNKNIY